jgi:hypothetical protein
VLLLCGLLLWRGEAWTRSLRAALAARVVRAVEGPPLPHSDRPQVVAGPIIRRALLLHDEVPVSGRPGGPATETIRHRMFVDIYDVWPLTGAPTHYRVGNRKPVGWVNAADVLPWDTRLVIRREGNAVTCPVLAGRPGGVEIAVWEAEQPWSAVARREVVPDSTVPPPSWGIWLAREELLALLRRTLAPGLDRAGASDQLHLRAVLGQLHDEGTLSDDKVQAARAHLPPPALDRAAGSLDEARERLARINEEWSAESSWGGLQFRFIPLDALP